MIKIINNDLEQYLKSFSKLYNHIFDDPEKGYNIYCFIDTLSKEITNLRNYRAELEKKYFEIDEESNKVILDENMNPIFKDPSLKDKYINLLEKLIFSESKVELPEDIKFSIKELKETNIPMSPSDWAVFSKFIDKNNTNIIE